MQPRINPPKGKVMEYISEIVSFIGGLGSGLALHVVSSRTSQNNNIVGGDIVGRDKIGGGSESSESQAIMNVIADHIDKKSEKLIKSKIEKILSDRKG